MPVYIYFLQIPIFANQQLKMLKKDRHKVIVQKVMLNRRVSSLELAEEYNVSEDTIRRDIHELDTLGLLAKVRGGAVSTIQKLYHYNEDAIFNRDHKEFVAKKAIALLEDGMVMIISGGTTNLMLAKLLPKELTGTVYTYSLQIAMQLTEHPNIDVIFIGGKIQKKSMVTIGIDVFKTLSSIHADVCFMGVSALNIEQGLTDDSYEVAQIKKAMISASDTVIALTTSNKLNVKQNYNVCNIEEIHTVITDLDPTNEIMEHYKNKGISVL